MSMRCLPKHVTGPLFALAVALVVQTGCGGASSPAPDARDPAPDNGAAEVPSEELPPAADVHGSDVHGSDAHGSDACTPDCAGRQCGSDGCGGSCGSCAEGAVCLDGGTCLCIPTCTGRACGDDGCGGSCGACPPGRTCKDGTCTCPFESCGNACCGEGESCVAGTCIARGCAPDPTGPGCGGCACEACVCELDPWCCEVAWDSLCVAKCDDHCDGPCCTPACEGRTCGPDGCGGECGTCKAGSVCDGGTCVPCEAGCTGRECGPDGCGGTCGACDAGSACTKGACIVWAPACAGIPVAGCCNGQVLTTCPGGVRQETACDVDVPGDGCGWDAAAGRYACGPASVVDPAGDPAGEHPPACGTACVADCEGKACGPDGCGGFCGACAFGLQCADGVCACPPDCDGKACGEDGCGGSCGDCAEKTTCQDGACVCAPDCAGRDCGDDGCGGSCGECVAGTVCGGDGRCAMSTCGAIDAVGCCDGDVLKACAAGRIETTDCASLGSPSCGWSAAADAYACGTDGQGDPDGQAPRECARVTACDGKACGPDGFGGNCGGCPKGLACTASGRCVDPCLTIKDSPNARTYGCCDGEVAWRCEVVYPDGKMTYVAHGLDCTDLPSCGWSDKARKYACATPGGSGLIDGYYEVPKACPAFCEPACGGRQCGPDPACGASCGACPGILQCVAGTCACVPDCLGRACGDDGCNGSCGACAPGTACSADGTCACAPSCDGKACGDDGCGGSCGTCAGGEVCVDGACLPEGCFPRDGGGCRGCACEACVAAARPDCLLAAWDADCVALCDRECGQDCPCVPDCGGRACGDDGCGGSCGDCPAGWNCVTGAGSCERDACAGVPPEGCCAGDQVRRCFDNVPASEDCGASGLSCGWIADGKAGPSTGYGCVVTPSADPTGFFPIACPGCVADCTGRDCGDDGCGGSCGICPGAGETCVGGSCVAVGCLARPEPWCHGCPCEDCVAALDSFCGTVAWDAACADLCVHACGGGSFCPCEPACADRQCGDDGCGGSCGTCGPGTTCQAGACVACSPVCGGRECGDDGCGGSCGTCTGRNETCIGGVCTCVPDCTGRQCGGDGCDGTCGACPAGPQWSCVDGVCREGCQASADKKCCAGDSAVRCRRSCVGKDTSEIGDTTVAGWYEFLEARDCAASSEVCGWQQTCYPSGCYPTGNDCGPNPDGDPSGAVPRECAPFECPGGAASCKGRECGPDGCGGTCGTCPEGERCSNAGLCYVPACAGKACGPDGHGGTCGVCPGAAVGIGCLDGACAKIPDGCQASGLPGCRGCAFEGCVCAAYPDCCGWAWTETCARYARIACGAADSCPCIPSCDGRQCGDDGCGGTCGDCPNGQFCESREPCDSMNCDLQDKGFQAFCCVPDCTGLGCGRGGCSKAPLDFCGTCPDGQVCDDFVPLSNCSEGLPIVAGTCCTPDCTGRECGSDGCHGSCGECGPDEYCSPEGQTCKPDPCRIEKVQQKGCCQGSVKIACDAVIGGGHSARLYDCAGNESYTSCGWEPYAAVATYECTGTTGSDPAGTYARDCDDYFVACSPDCAGKECGNGGCMSAPGDACGTCAAGQYCDPFDGTCRFDPCDIDLVRQKGCCDGSKLVKCKGPDHSVDVKRCDPAETCGWENPWGGWGAYTFDCAPSATPDPSGEFLLACSDYDKPCTPDCAGRQCGQGGCKNAPFDACGTCPAGSVCHPANEGTCCTKDCAGKVCGSDGCGGECGSCLYDESCIGGQCEWDVCKVIGNTGCCEAETLYWCEGADLYYQDCLPTPLCGWSTYGYYCGTDGATDPKGLFPKACPAP